MIEPITGNQNPRVGETSYYEVNVFSILGGLNPAAQYEWKLYKKSRNGLWTDITHIPKKGQRVAYTFGEICLGHQLRIEAYEVKPGLLPSLDKKKIGEIIVSPTSSKVPKIQQVVLFNRSGKDVNKANYRDTLIARAYCVGLFNAEIEFQLWEDDAAGKGHNPVVNKNNRQPRVYTARVNENGIAQVQIPLSSDERILRQIANTYLMPGDANEGATHEYYVTASYMGKGQKASQVNVAVTNPDYKLQPQKDTPKFPATRASSTPAQPGATGKVTDAYFVKDAHEKLTKVLVGEQVSVLIKSNGLVGQHVQYRVWEYDAGSHDLVYESGRLKVVDNTIKTGGFTITAKLFAKGVDIGSIDPDAKKQNYFIEIILLDVSAASKKFGVTADGLMEVENATSPAMVREKKVEEKDDSKICECEAKVRAFMRMIRKGEGTIDEGGYSRIVGGSSFRDHGKDFTTHPKVYIKDHDSTAAGAYQITKTNWNDNGFVTWRANHNITDFSPESQDIYAAYLIIKKKKAFEKIKNNDFRGAVEKCRTEWASLPGAGYGQREEAISTIENLYKKYLQEELSGEQTEAKLHIRKGFLKKYLEIDCCNEQPIASGNINKYRINVDKYIYTKILENKESRKYQYDIYENNKLIKSFTLDKNEHGLLPFPESGNNWGRFGTRDQGGDNWVNEKVCAALLGFFHSLPKNGYSDMLYYNDISANDGRNIGHSGHNISGNDVDIRYPGSGNGDKTIWRDAMKVYGTEEKFIEVLENIIGVGVKWGFNKNYAYKSDIKNTTGKATSVHQDHFHLGLR